MTLRRLVIAFALLAMCCGALAQARTPNTAPADAKKLNDVVFAKVGTRELLAFFDKVLKP